MVSKKGKSNDVQKSEAGNLEAIKRLLILQLRMLGVTSEDIGRTLNLDPSTIRHIASLKNSKKSDK